MSDKQPSEIRAEKLFDFLFEDFHDTASHMRDTDHKIEFTFQLNAGAFSVLISITISILAITLGNKDWNPENNVYVIYSILSLFIFIWSFTLWAFLYTVRGTMMRTLYINRMNFLRNEIYQYLKVKRITSPKFLYISKYLPSESLQKVGMVDMFPIGLSVVLTSLPFPFFVFLYILLKDTISFHWSIYAALAFIVAFYVWRYTHKVWKEIIKDTSNKIEQSWETKDTI